MLAAPDAAVAAALQPKAVPAAATKQLRATLHEAWGVVKDLYLDASFNRLDWDKVLQGAEEELAAASDPEQAGAVIPHMLAQLGDPYTRLIPATRSAAFRDDTVGQVVHAGLQVAPLEGGQLQVAFVAPDSPASRAGIRVGDVVVALDGHAVSASDVGAVREQLHEEGMMQLRRAERSSAGRLLREQHFAVHLVPEPLELYPVHAKLLRNKGQPAIGFLHFTSFAESTAREVTQALQQLQRQGAQAFVMDLRDNAGGLVSAGTGIAELLLSEGRVFGHVHDQHSVGDPLHVGPAGGAKMTTQPLVVLVNHGTASTSELLSGALHDNNRAKLLGTHTFGKGRTQRWRLLQDGSTLLVSSASITTPAHHEIHQVGLDPDTFCTRPDTPDTNSDELPLDEDPCVILAQQQLTLQHRAQHKPWHKLF